MSEQAYVHQRVIDLMQEHGDDNWQDLMTVLVKMIASLEYKVKQLEDKDESMPRLREEG